MTETIDLKKQYASYYNPPARPVILTVPAFNYLKVDGAGNPNNNPQFQSATEALYALAYTIRFAYKAAADAAYTVMPLEGLWWAEDMDTFLTRDKAAWQWTLMILQPEFISAELVAQSRAEALRKKKLSAEQLDALRFEPYAAGECVTMMHTGTYDAETESIALMHRTAREQGYELAGLHQEIYLSDPRKTAPEKMKTVLRQPIRKADTA